MPHLALTTLFLALAAQAPPAQPPVDVPPGAVDCGTVDQLLTRLERVGDEVRSFRAGLAYEKYDAFLDEAEQRFGRLVLEGTGDGRRFAFLFDRFYDGGGREESMRDHWLYAGGWLTEANHDRKTFTKRQIVEPGKRFDPLKLGEGPFPVPFGQAKAEVEARFAVELCEVPPLPRLRSITDVCGLRLLPKEGSAMAKDTEKIEVFYEREGLALRAIVLSGRNGDRTTVVFSRPALNVDLSAEDRALLALADPDPRDGWAIDIRPWQGPQDESALAQPPIRTAPRTESP